MTTVIYARVSTDQQTLDHQEQHLREYVREDLAVPTAEIDVLRDKSTGTDTDRSGYRELMDRVRAGDVDRVVVREFTRLGRSMRQINEVTHEIVEDHGVGLFVKNDDFAVQPGETLDMAQKMKLTVLGWAGELEAKKARENSIEGQRAAAEAGKWVGRPPYGFTTDDDGYLQPTDEFGNALDAIRAVEELGWSHRKAARHSGVPRRTVESVVERKELYLRQEDGTMVE